MKTNGQQLVLALYPSSHGLAFTLFEAPLSLIDWGVKITRGVVKNEYCIDYAEQLFARYSPDVIVIQDTGQPGSRRSERIRALYRALALLAQLHDVDVARYGKADVDKAFNAAGALTKHERARLVAAMLPELSHRIPPVRKPWMSEHPRMPLFEAASLGIAQYFHQHQSR